MLRPTGASLSGFLGVSISLLTGSWFFDCVLLAIVRLLLRLHDTLVEELALDSLVMLLNLALPFSIIRDNRDVLLILISIMEVLVIYSPSALLGLFH